MGVLIERSIFQLELTHRNINKCRKKMESCNCLMSMFSNPGYCSKVNLNKRNVAATLISKMIKTTKSISQSLILASIKPRVNEASAEPI